MKALTLWQPWASLVARGRKRWETRSWGTNYRGLLAIHAAKRWETDQRGLCAESPFMEALGLTREESYRLLLGKAELPLGAIVAVGKLVDVRPTESLDVRDEEAAFGDFSPGRFAWCLEDVETLPHPIDCRGYQGLWDVPRDVIERIATWLSTQIDVDVTLLS